MSRRLGISGGRYVPFEAFFRHVFKNLFLEKFRGKLFSGTRNECFYVPPIACFSFFGTTLKIVIRAITIKCRIEV